MKNLLEKLNECIQDRKVISKMIKKTTNELEKNLSELENLEEARVIVQKAAQVTQSQLSNKVESIVSSALAAVFDDPYKFVVDFVQRRNSTECDLFFEKNGNKLSPLNSCGYGVADITSLALRVAYWKMESDSRNVLILDEPTRALSLAKHERASMMIKELSKVGKGIQFLIVTHSVNMAMYADKKFKVTKQGGISRVDKIS